MQQWWFHKWSSTLSDQFKSRKLPSSRRAQHSSRLTNTLTWGEEPHYKVSRSRILLVSYMWHFNVVFMLPHVVVTSGVNSNKIESVHQKWRFKTQPSTQVQLFVSKHKCFIWLPTRGIQVVILQVQEVQLQVVAIDLHMANFMWLRSFFMVIDDKGGEKCTKIWIILWWQRGRWDESAIMDMD